MLLRIILFAACFSIFSSTVGNPSSRFPQEPDPRPWKNREIVTAPTANFRRLPTDVIPSHYKLKLRPILDINPTPFTAPGEVTITVQAVSSTNTITFNQRGLTIDAASVSVTNSATGSEIPVVEQSANNDEFTYTLVLGQDLQASQEYKIFVRFVAPIPSNPLAGLYRSSYTDPNTNEVRYLAATQFERMDARRAFPCFDEPSFKAVFEISLGRTEDYNTLCNMRIVSTTPDETLEGWVWDNYEPTVVMSSYLIGIVVSDFTYEEAPPELFNGKISRTWGVPYKLTPGSGIYGAETSAKVITYFEQHYNVSYDLPKMDSGAIPDFSPGAMENWGLVLYRENLLLYYNGTTNEASRRSISSVISHELAHQWFGNIITMHWWNDIWLKEGFATYASYWSMASTDPEYDPSNWIMTDSYQAAMAYDIGVNSQPVSNDGDTPGAIIYDKGASIMRMAEGFLSESTTLKALQKYLQRHSYGNVVQDDLFQALTEQGEEDGTLPAGLTVKDIMDTWTHQTGFPLIRVSATGPNELTITQESYGPNPRKVNTTVLDPNDLWYVPISYHNEANPDSTGSNRQPKAWIAKTATSITHQVDTTKWIFINTASTGYFRVLYDDNLRTLLRQQLERDASVISIASRSQTIDDYLKFSFAVPAYTSIQHAMDFTTYLSQEDKLPPWQSFFDNMGTAFDYFSGSATYYSVFKDYFADRVNGALNLLGVEQSDNNGGDKVILRLRLLQWGCAFGLPSCYEYANKLRLQWVANPLINPVPVDIRDTMYCAIVAADGEAGYYFALGKFFEATTTWRNALGCAADPAAIDQVLELSLNSQTGISKNDAAGLMQRVAMTPEGRARFWSFLQNRFNDIMSYHDAGAVAGAISTLSNYLSDPQDLINVQAFIDENRDALISQSESLNNSIRSIERNVAWMGNYGQSMVEFFNDQKMQ